MHGHNVRKGPTLDWLTQSQGCVGCSGGSYFAWAIPTQADA